VLTLVAGRPQVQDSQAGAACATPSVVHFGVVLLLSAVLSAPWSGTGTVAVSWGLIGLIGTIYAVIVVRRMRAQNAYKPVFEDWLFHCLLPASAYAVLFVSAWIASSHTRHALFLVATATLLVLFIGIHNAWDGVTYHIFTTASKDRDKHDESQ